MKIVIWTERFYPDIGGLEYAMFRLACEFASYGAAVEVLTTQKYQSSNFRVVHFSKKNFIETSTNYIRENALDIGLLYISRIFQRKEEKHLKFISGLGNQIPIALRIPTTFNLKQVKHTDKYNVIENDIRYLITLNETSKKYCEQLYSKLDVRLIRNKIKPPSDYRICYKSYFLFAGRITPSKNLYKLLKAYKKYSEQTKDPISLKIYGTPYDEVYFKKCIQFVQENPTIEFCGVYESGSLSVIDKAAFVIIPSIREGHSNLQIECFNTGTPVISSNIPGLKEGLPNDYQFFIQNPNSTKEITQKLFLAHKLSAQEYSNCCSAIRQRSFEIYQNSADNGFLYKENVSKVVACQNLSLLVIKPEALNRQAEIIEQLSEIGYSIRLNKTYSNWGEFMENFYLDFSSEAMAALKELYRDTFGEKYVVVIVSSEHESTIACLSEDKGNYFDYQDENLSLRGKFGLEKKYNVNLNGRIVTFNGIHAIRTVNEFINSATFLKLSL